MLSRRTEACGSAGRPTRSFAAESRGGQTEALLILDPINGQSPTEAGKFPGTYFGGATLDGHASSHDPDKPSSSGTPIMCALTPASQVSTWVMDGSVPAPAGGSRDKVALGQPPA